MNIVTHTLYKDEYIDVMYILNRSYEGHTYLAALSSEVSTTSSDGSTFII